MLAVLMTIWVSLRHTRSTHDTVPSCIARMVLAWCSHPMSLAKWLNVPAGNTASGRPVSTATAAAHATVPSPPPMPSTSARSAAARSTSLRLSFLASSTISAFGSSRRTSRMTRAPVPLPDAGLTTTTTPAPSGRGGVSMRSGSAAAGCARRSAGPGARPTRRSTRRCRSPRRRRRGSGRRSRRAITQQVRQGAQSPALVLGSPVRRRRRMRQRWRSDRRAANGTSGIFADAAAAERTRDAAADVATLA